MNTEAKVAGHRCCVELRRRGEGRGDHQGEKRSKGKREGNRKTGARLRKMERSGKPAVRCGFDFSCQSSVILGNQSHMS